MLKLFSVLLGGRAAGAHIELHAATAPVCLAKITK